MMAFGTQDCFPNGFLMTEALHTLESLTLNNRNLFSHSSGGWKSELRVPAWSVSDESALPGLQMPPSRVLT